jgi:hypothetical protein
MTEASKRTPRPWQVVDCPDYGEDCTRVLIVRAESDDVCVVCAHSDCDEPREKSNAALIAAAPDMLAALKAALAALDPDSIDGAPIDAKSLRAAQSWMRAKFGETARAAIAKAEGR